MASSSTSKPVKKSMPTASTKKPLGDYRQNSFESRYSSIIAKQIMDNDVNQEELKRQLHIFMPFNSLQHKDITTKKIMMNRNSSGSVEDGEDEATTETTSDN